jgi:hypothetical protein
VIDKVFVPARVPLMLSSLHESSDYFLNESSNST